MHAVLAQPWGEQMRPWKHWPWTQTCGCQPTLSLGDRHVWRADCSQVGVSQQQRGDWIHPSESFHLQAWESTAKSTVYAHIAHIISLCICYNSESLIIIVHLQYSQGRLAPVCWYVCHLDGAYSWSDKTETEDGVFPSVWLAAQSWLLHRILVAYRKLYIVAKLLQLMFVHHCCYTCCDRLLDTMPHVEMKVSKICHKWLDTHLPSLPRIRSELWHLYCVPFHSESPVREGRHRACS